MRKVLLILALLGVTTGAWATPENLFGGMFVAHNVDQLPYSTTPPAGGWCGAYAGYAINSSEQVDVELPWDPVGNTWYVLAAWELESKTWCGTEFGLGPYDAALYVMLDWFPCFPVAGLEQPTPGWPGPNEGTAFVTTGTPWSGNWVPVYWFGGYSYPASYGSTVMPISVDPSTGFCGFSNCMNPPALFSVPHDWRGAMGVNTAGVVPPHWPPGPPWACCLPEPLGTCLMLTEEDCALAGGIWMGSGVLCDPNPCPQPGACCIGGNCSVMLEENCGLLGGAFQGPNTTCDPNPCPAVCCLPWGCMILFEQECLQQMGEWHPEWTTCVPNPCEYYPSPREVTTWGQIKLLYR